MKCPKCNKEIDHVDITSDYGSSSVGYLEGNKVGCLKGNKIVEYEMIVRCMGEEFSELISIECPECNKDISDVVER